MPGSTTDNRLRKDILFGATLLGALTCVLASLAAWSLTLGTDYIWRAIACFFAATATVYLFAARVAGLAQFGAANQMTLLRVALVALVAAALGESPHPTLSWTIVVVVTLALFLDGFDGRIARRTGTSSDFGARFDMETDAALIMILSLLCWQFDKAGIWILAAGAMRYGFVAAGSFLSWMRQPLPYSRRRQAVCIWQSGLMLGVISPLFPRPASEVLAAGTLTMLFCSFATDIRWLWRHRGPARGEAVPTSLD